MKIDPNKFKKFQKFNVLNDCMLVCVCRNVNSPDCLYYSIKEVFMGYIVIDSEEEEIISYAEMDHL